MDLTFDRCQASSNLEFRDQSKHCFPSPCRGNFFSCMRLHPHSRTATSPQAISLQGGPLRNTSKQLSINNTPYISPLPSPAVHHLSPHPINPPRLFPPKSATKCASPPPTSSLSWRPSPAPPSQPRKSSPKSSNPSTASAQRKRATKSPSTTAAHWPPTAASSTPVINAARR